MIGNERLPWAGLNGIMFGGQHRSAMQQRQDELPPEERLDGAYALAAVGATFVRVGPGGEVRDYNPAADEWVKREDEKP